MASGGDIAARFIADLDESVKATPVTPQEARRVLWKTDLTILPLLSMSAIVAAADKIIISNAAIYGMKDDAHLIGDQYAWVGSAFAFGFLLFEYPSNLLMQRLPVAKFLSFMVLTWGILMCCTAATHNFAGLAAVRFIMGMAEACLLPGCTIITVMWWKTEEQPCRVAFWMSQVSSLFIGPVSYGIGTAHTRVASWRLLFLAFGAFSLLWSIVLFLLLPDSPTQSPYLTPREKYICLHRVRHNNTGVEDKRIKWHQVRECLRDPKTWLLCLFAFGQNIPHGGLLTFAPQILTSLSHPPLTTVLLNTPTGLLATGWSLTLALLLRTSPHKNLRTTVIALSNLLPITAALGLRYFTSPAARLAAYYLFYTYWAPWILGSSLHMANTSGHSKKVATNALYFVAYCLGNVVGPQAFRAADAPGYRRGYVACVGCLGVATGAVVAYGVVCRVENGRRERAAGVVGDGEAFTDGTDGEKKGFWYTY